MPDHSDGYTILELLVTLAILSLATTASLGLLSVNSSEKQSMVLAKQLESAFVDARVQALTHHRPSTVELKLGDRFEVMVDGKDLFSETLQSMSVVATSGKMEGFKASTSQFVFFPNGTSTGGSIAFREQQTLTLLQLSWFTGLADVSVSRQREGLPEDRNGTR